MSWRVASGFGAVFHEYPLLSSMIILQTEQYSQYSHKYHGTSGNPRMTGSIRASKHTMGL